MKVKLYVSPLQTVLYSQEETGQTLTINPLDSETTWRLVNTPLTQ